MLESQADIDKPKYDRVTQGTQVKNHTFTNIDEATSFWRSLWEEKGSGDTEAEWIEEVREAMEDVLPEVPTDDWNLNAVQYKFLRSSRERKTGANLAPTVLLISGGKRQQSWIKK